MDVFEGVLLPKWNVLRLFNYLGGKALLRFCQVDFAGDVHKWRHDQAVHRQVTLMIRVAGAKADCFGFGGGDVKRAEHPVPD